MVLSYVRSSIEEWIACSVLLLGAAACGVESQAPASEGIANGGGSAGQGMADGGAAPGEGGAGSLEEREDDGVVVLNTDYGSTTISVVAANRDVLSPLLIHSGSALPDLSAALSGDVVLPMGDLKANEAVLIDRSQAVLTWVSLNDAAVRAQLDVGTGFNANPHDYAELAPDLAYVSRFESNENRGQEPHDGGGDLLVIDPSKPAIVGRVDLELAMLDAAEGLLPRPNGILTAGGRPRVLLAGLAADYGAVAEARIVSVNPDDQQISQTLILEGFRNCTQFALSPNGEQIAISCPGFFRQDSADGYPDAGVVLVDVGDELAVADDFGSEHFRYCFAADDCQNVQVNSVEYVDEQTLLVTTFGKRKGESYAGPEWPDMLFRLDLETGQAERLLSAAPFSLNHARCLPSRCFVTDAEQSVLRAFERTDGGQLEQEAVIEVETEVGLPPRRLQRF